VKAKLPLDALSDDTPHPLIRGLALIAIDLGPIRNMMQQSLSL